MQVCAIRGWGERHWKSWYVWATHSRLALVIKVARMLKRRLDREHLKTAIYFHCGDLELYPVTHTIPR